MIADSLLQIVVFAGGLQFPPGEILKLSKTISYTASEAPESIRVRRLTGDPWDN
jgi:hypothetical protein